MTPQPSPQLVTLCLDAVRLAKCTPSPKWHRPALQLAPRGYSCRCGAQAAVILDGEDQAACCSCALDEVSIDELYAVTHESHTAADLLGAALDSFARWAERTYDEMTDREYCGGSCLNCQERAADRQALADAERELREGGIGR